MYDAVVIGGGLGGLAAGALLTKKGFRVLLAEQKRTLGGRSNSFEYKEGYTVDFGIHLLRFGDKGIATEVLRMLGEKLEVLELGEGKLFHKDKWFELPTKAEVLTRTPLLEDEDKKLVGGLLAKIVGTPPQKVLNLSIGDWLNDAGVGERIKLIMRLISKLCITTHIPDELSCGEVFSVISGVLKAGKSVGYPKGGWKTIIDRLSASIQNGGGEVKTKARVEKIAVDDRKKVTGVVLEGSTVEASTVVYCAPCQQLHNLVGEDDLGLAFLERANSMTPTAGIDIDFGLRGKATDSNGMFAVYDPFILAQFTSNIDPSVAPTGQQLATFLYVMSPEDIRDKTKVGQAYEILENYAFKMFPRMKELVLWRRRIALSLVDGVLPTPLQSREKRIGFVGPAKGLYFAGDCYDGEGGGSDIAFHSAKRCAEVIANK